MAVKGEGCRADLNPLLSRERNILDWAVSLRLLHNVAGLSQVTRSVSSSG